MITIVAMWHCKRARARYGVIEAPHWVIHRLASEYRIQWRPGTASDSIRGLFDIVGRHSA